MTETLLETEIINAVHKLRNEDDSLEDIGNCREASATLAKLITDIAPWSVKILRYSPNGDESNAHYAIMAVLPGQSSVIINSVPAPGFPEYIGPAEMAHPNFSEMTEVKKIA